MAATHFLPLLVGHQSAAKLLLSGELISAEEAVRVGIVSELTEDGNKCVERSLELAEKMATNSSIAVKTTLLTLRSKSNEGLSSALQREADAQAECYAADDLREGLEAVKNKRDPKFK